MKQVIKTGKGLLWGIPGGNIIFRDYSRFLIKTM